ncbi:hypothetical protein PQX77_002231 [Marasmius sp. AFHP31]|nr:hypothetical protein PQX77_002231 [Marasmius sp. AFHP31]
MGSCRSSSLDTQNQAESEFVKDAIYAVNGLPGQSITLSFSATDLDAELSHDIVNVVSSQPPIHWLIYYLGANANFQAIAGNSTTIQNYNTSEREDRLTVRGRTVRKVIDGDIIFQRVLSSEVLSVKFKPEGASTSTESQVVKIKKMEQTAEIYGYQGKFTVTSLEPVEEKDREKFKEIAKIVLETAMCGRSALLKQIFAVAESENTMTTIACDGELPVGNLNFRPSKAVELADGFVFSDQYYRGKEWIVLYYLDYTLADGVQALRADGTLRFPVTNRWRDWSFNVRNLTWQYNPASLCLDPPEEQHLIPILYPTPPLRQETLRHLDTAEIIALVEESLGDVLFLIAALGGTWDTSLSYYARHGLLTLGTVVNRWEPEILAHLSSTPSPEWFCWSRNPDVKADVSSSGRVDLSFQKTGDVKVVLQFGWRIPEKDPLQLECAFLCQSLHFGDDCEDVTDVVYIDEVGFNLQCTFPVDPTNCSTPAYLFVHPLPTDFINNLHCIRYPLPEKLFYWSHDPQGRIAIAEEDWERFGIPKLSVQEWVCSFWRKEHYAVVREHLRSRSCSLDGKQYAREHGYPDLILADPHDTARLEELEWSESDIPEPETSPPATSRQPFRPSGYLKNAIRDMKTRRHHKHEARRLTAPSPDS